MSNRRKILFVFFIIPLPKLIRDKSSHPENIFLIESIFDKSTYI